MKHILIFCLFSFILVGCATKIVEYTKTTEPNGSIIEKTITTTKDQWLTNKTIAGSGSVQALKVESTGGTTTATMLPNCIIGGANAAGVSTPCDDNKPVCAYSKSVSLFGSLTSASASGVSWVYIGTEGETAEQTAKRLKSLKVLMNTDQTDSSISE